MSDKELLMLAAKAHGDLVYVEDQGWIHEKNGVRGAWWNPLDNDADALRLAVVLRIDIQHHNGFVVAIYDDGFLMTGKVKNGRDPCKATRRAIVRAAAALGVAQ